MESQGVKKRHGGGGSVKDNLMKSKGGAKIKVKAGNYKPPKTLKLVVRSDANEESLYALCTIKYAHEEIINENIL